MIRCILQIRKDAEPWHHLGKATQLRPLNFTASWFPRQGSFPFLLPVYLPDTPPRTPACAQVLCFSRWWAECKLSLSAALSSAQPGRLCGCHSSGSSFSAGSPQAFFLSVWYSRNSAYSEQHISAAEVLLQPFIVPVVFGRDVRSPVQFAGILCLYAARTFFVIWLFNFPFSNIF